MPKCPILAFRKLLSRLLTVPVPTSASSVARRKVRTGPHRPEDLSNNLSVHSNLWGIYVGDGCVTGLAPLDWIGIHAHAHNRSDDEWFGWICIADPANVITSAGNPTAVLKHEIAHLYCPDENHSKNWKMVVTLLGAPKEAEIYERHQNGKVSSGTAGRTRCCQTA